MQVSKDAYVDIFGLPTPKETEEATIQTGFSAGEVDEADILNIVKKEDVKVEESHKTEEQQKDEVDILGDGKKEELPSEDITPLVNFFQERIKRGIFSSLVDEEGNDVALSKPEDIDAFLEANLEYKLEKERRELEQNWYQTKSPAWKAVAQYAEYIDDPSQLTPFLQGVSNVQSINNIDETTIDGAEQIVRYKMKLSGDDDETINEQIDLLKNSDKIVDIAKRYKPVLVQNETQRLAEMQQKAEQEKTQYIQMVQQYEQAAIDTIEKPLFGEKLSQEEKAIVYDLIAIPNQELGGYPIFAAIDNLYEKNDLETLKEIALLIANKQNYYKYASKAATLKTANDLQRKLRVQLESDKKSSGKDDPEVRTIKAPAQKQQGKPRFGF